jgi:hypothetical protein
MRSRKISMPLLGAIAATRGMLGAGIGLLLARRLDERRRRTVGRTLLTIGIASTVPLLVKFVRSNRSHRRSDWNAEEVLG